MTLQKLHDFKEGEPVRHKRTGDLYFYREGKFIRDNPRSPLSFPETQHHHFISDTDATKLPVGALASVCYAADRALCSAHRDLKPGKEWPSLHPQEKAKWIEGKIEFPKDQLLRLKLYNAIREIMIEECHE
jgi:hypothetical protein